MGAWKTRPPGSSPWLRGLSSILLFSRCILGEGQGSDPTILSFFKDLVVTFYLGKVWCCVVERVNRSLSLPPLDSPFSSSSGSSVLSPPVPTASVLTCIFQIANILVVPVGKPKQVPSAKDRKTVDLRDKSTSACVVVGCAGDDTTLHAATSLPPTDQLNLHRWIQVNFGDAGCGDLGIWRRCRRSWGWCAGWAP